MFYIIPYFFIYNIFGNGNQGKENKINNLRKALTTIFYFIYLCFSYKIMGLFKEELPWFFIFFIRPVYLMEYLGIIGILLSAFLSGYGSTHCILNYIIYPFFKSKTLIIYLEKLKKLERSKKSSIFNLKEEISFRKSQIFQRESSLFDKNGEDALKSKYSLEEDSDIINEDLNEEHSSSSSDSDINSEYFDDENVTI